MVTISAKPLPLQLGTPTAWTIVRLACLAASMSSNSPLRRRKATRQKKAKSGETWEPLVAPDFGC